MKLVTLFLILTSFKALICEKDLASYDDKTNTNTNIVDGFTAITRYYIVKATGACRTINYQGKGLDFNNFKSLEECENHKKKTANEILNAISSVISTANTNPNAAPVSICTGADVAKYYFKKTVNNGQTTYSCEQFNYKGCGAGDNIFDTLKDCNDAKASIVDKVVNKLDCEILPTTTNNYKNEIKVVADMQTRKCVYAIVSDDHHNGVFKSIKECTNTCISKRKEINPNCHTEVRQQPPCQAKVVEKFFFNRLTGICELFYTNDCVRALNMNMFDNLDECIGSCPTSHDVESSDPISLKTTGDLCKLQKNEGVGILTLIRFFFDRHTSTCRMFQYRGIGGNENNFISKEECMAVCTGQTVPIQKTQVTKSTEEIKDKESNNKENGSNNGSTKKDLVDPKATNTTTTNTSTDKTTSQGDKKNEKTFADEGEKEMEYELQY